MAVTSERSVSPLATLLGKLKPTLTDRLYLWLGDIGMCARPCCNSYSRVDL